jgi:hypothetical protein
MWAPTYHQFASAAAWRTACDAAGWARDHLGEPMAPPGVAVDLVGALASPGYHVNLAWHAREPDAAFAASTITPATPSRVWA